MNQYISGVREWLLVSLCLFAWCVKEAEGAIEEIEATPTNTNAVELGDVSMPQFLVFCIVFLLIVTLYGLRIIPIEIDLGFYFGTGSGSLLPRKLNQEISLNRLLYDCPLQYVCEVDFWANRTDHEHFLEKLLASWFKNPDSKFQSAKGAAFAGTGTCREMYPCPFDVQKVVGIHIPGSRTNSSQIIPEGNEADLHVDFTE